MESHLLQMRGLKLNILIPRTLIPKVASFTDAWIETTPFYSVYNTTDVASFTDAWIETISVFCDEESIVVASFTDAWIETLSQPKS